MRTWPARGCVALGGLYRYFSRTKITCRKGKFWADIVHPSAPPNVERAAAPGLTQRCVGCTYVLHVRSGVPRLALQLASGPSWPSRRPEDPFTPRKIFSATAQQTLISTWKPSEGLPPT